MTQQEAQDLLKKFKTKAAAAKAAKMSHRSFSRRLNGETMGEVRKITSNKKSRSIEEFKNLYDKNTIIPQRVQAALEKLGADGWEYEVAFAKIAGVSLADLGNYREQFIEHVIPLPDHRRAWAGTVETATALKELIS